LKTKQHFDTQSNNTSAILKVLV